MKAEIISDLLVVSFEDRSIGSWIVLRKDRKSGNKDGDLKFINSSQDGLGSVSIDLVHFNAATHTLVLEGDKGELDLTPALERFQLDHSKVDNHEYMTRTIFGAGIRTLSQDDLMYLLYCNLDVLNISNQFYGGLITVLSFRIAENIDRRSVMIEKVYQSYKRFFAEKNKIANHSIRWKISSTVNLAIILLYVGNENEAQQIVEDALSCSYYNTMFPLTFMNYATLLALGGMMALDRGDLNVAYLRFAECAGFCNSSVADLFSLRNNYFFQHEQDVRTLIDIGFHAGTALAALSSARHPGDSKFTFNAKSAPFARSNFAVVFGRFRSILNRLPNLSERTVHSVRTIAEKSGLK